MLPRWFASRARRGDRGFSAIEVLVAMMILGAAATFSVQVIHGAGRTTAQVEETDRATKYGYDMLERARALGCGTEVFNENLSGRARNCGNKASSLGPAHFSFVDEKNREYEAVITTRWGRSDVASSANCQNLRSPAIGAVVSTPNILIRTVTLNYPQGLLRGQRTIQFVESVPPDAAVYNSQVRGGIVIAAAPPNTGVASIDNGAGVTIQRVADAAGCIWFPFLPTGPRTVTVGGTSSVVIDVTENATTCRTYVGEACP